MFLSVVTQRYSKIGLAQGTAFTNTCKGGLMATNFYRENIGSEPPFRPQ